MRHWGKAVAVVMWCACSPPPSSSVAVSVPEQIDFGRVAIGTMKTLPVRITNTGSGAVDLTRFDSTSADTAFTLAFTASSLEAGRSVDVPATFTGDGAAHDATFVLHSSAADVSTRLVAQAGNVNCQVVPTLDFGLVTVGDSFHQSFTVTNNGTAVSTVTVGAVTASTTDDVSFTLNVPAGTQQLAPGSSLSFDVDFHPDGAKDFFAWFPLRLDALCPEKQVKLSGTGSTGVLGCGTTHFPYVTLGAAVTKSVTLSNDGFVPVTLSATVASPEYFIDGGSLVVPPARRVDGGVLAAGTVELPVTFRPGDAGFSPAWVDLATSLPKQMHVLCPLTGHGGGPDIDITPTTLDLGDVAYFAGQSYAVSRKLVIRNIGTAPMPADPLGNLLLGAFTVTPKNADSPASALCVGPFDPVMGCLGTFGPAYDPAVGLLAGDSLDVPIRVQPADTGKNLEWEVTFPSNDADEPSVAVTVKAHSVTVAPCQYTLSPSPLAFGVTPIGAPREAAISLHNTGTAACLVDRVALAPGTNPIFSLSSGALEHVMVAAGATLDVRVRINTSAVAFAATGSVEFAIASPSMPVQQVPLSGDVVDSCLLISPDARDFGVVQQNCSSAAQTFSIRNVCVSSVTVNSFSLTGSTELSFAGIPGLAAGQQLFPGAPNPPTFAVQYHPTNMGPDTASFSISVMQQGRVVTYDVPLSGAGDTSGANVETFTQPMKQKVDLLLVIDDSGSMTDKQMNLAANITGLLTPAASVDYHIGVIATEIGAAREGRLIADPPDGGGPPGPKVLTPMTPSVAAVLADRVVSIGLAGGYEGMAGPALRALTPPLSSTDNAGFLRSDAALAIIAITDASDQSPAGGIALGAQLAALKAPGQISYSVMGPFSPAAPANCSYDEAQPDLSSHHYLTSLFNGAEEEICTTDWPLAVSHLAAVAFRPHSEFTLHGDPDLATLAVQVDGITPPASAWSYDGARNTVSFVVPYLPSAGQTVTVSYTAVCH